MFSALRPASLGAVATCLAAAVAFAPLSASARGASGRYLRLADAAVATARSRWWDARLGWYSELRANDPRPQEATLWTVYPLFEAVSWTAIASPSAGRRRAAAAFAQEATRYWNAGAGGFSYSAATARNPRAVLYFDDNGWFGIAFLDAFRATGDRSDLVWARRALNFVLTRGLTSRGTLWREGSTRITSEPLAAAAYIAASLYAVDRRSADATRARSLIAWARVHSFSSSRGVFVRSPTDATALDYVQGMVIGALLELCSGGDRGACPQAVTLGDASLQAFPQPLAWSPGPDGIYLRFLLDLYRSTHLSRFLAPAQTTARRALALRAGPNLYPGSWTGRPSDAPPLQNHGATTALLAQLAAAS